MELKHVNLNENEILKLRIKDLPLHLEASDVYPWVQEVLHELEAKSLNFRPRIYFGDEWFSPEGQNAIAVPFFLAHKKLRQLEKKMMLECEGDTEESFKRLFRHELGHAFDHAFGVSRRKSWQKIFGSNKKPYTPESYRPRPYSKNFVRNISETYAQAHPDEDFAETFACWLDPQSDWRNKYKSWGALKKLVFVDKLCGEFKNRVAPPAKGKMLCDARYLQSNLERYYQRKRKAFEDDYPDFYDKDLVQIFAQIPSKSFIPTTGTALIKASSFMRKQRRDILKTISLWTKERKITISKIYDKLIDRANELDLVLSKDIHQTSIELTAFLSTLVSHYRFTGHFKRQA
ncbi:MAG: putative zinc-binding metallopeptidase [Bdellovibrionota bacterium]